MIIPYDEKFITQRKSLLNLTFSCNPTTKKVIGFDKDERVMEITENYMLISKLVGEEAHLAKGFLVIRDKDTQDLIAEHEVDENIWDLLII